MRFARECGGSGAASLAFIKSLRVFFFFSLGRVGPHGEGVNCASARMMYI